MNEFLIWSTALLSVLVLTGMAAQATEVVIDVGGVVPKGGDIRVAAFASAADYEAGRATKGVIVEATGDRVRAVISDLPEGVYGFAIFQDEDGNEEVSKNFIGIPNEPYTFSNDARGRFGPPGFDEMAVSVSGDRVELAVTLK